MANTLLTPEMITDEALMVLHQKSSFLRNVDRQYDDRFARSGAKIGENLNVRLPVKYVTRSGAQLAVQNTVERKVTLPVATLTGVDMNFSQQDLTMKIQDFSARYIVPAISQLAATLTYNAYAMYKQVGNYVGGGSSTTFQMSFNRVSDTGEILSNNLAPVDGRMYQLSPRSKNNFLSDTKGLFQASDNISEQYRQGKLGTTGGFDFYEDTLIPKHTVGTYSGTPRSGSSSVTTTQGNAGTGNAWVETSTIVTDGWTSGGVSLKAGDIVTFDGVYSVHPETKQTTGQLMKFAITEDISDTSGEIDMVLRPGVIYGGAYQNVTGGIPNNTTINVIGTSATTYGQDMAFTKEAFIFATADLENPAPYGAWAARRQFEGISMLISRQYDINNFNIPCRIDILSGFCVPYPELACRNLYGIA